jgi:hypothetical protein
MMDGGLLGCCAVCQRFGGKYCLSRQGPVDDAVCSSETLVKGKGVPLHVMEAHGGRGVIAPTHT